MNRILAFLYREFVFNGHMQSVGAAGIVAVSNILLFSQINWGLMFICYSTFQSIYYFDRYRDNKRDYITNRVRNKHIRSYQNLIPSLIMLLAFASFIFSYYISGVLFSLVVLLVLVLGYAYPVYMKGLTKHIPLFKNIYVASVHALLVIFPLIFIHLPVERVPMKLVIYVFVEAILAQFTLDTKDTYSDAKAGLKTMPSFIGNINTLRFVFLLSLLNLYLILDISLLLGIVMVLVNMASIYLISKKRKTGYFLAASKFMLWLCSLFFM